MFACLILANNVLSRAQVLTATVAMGAATMAQ